VSHIIDSKLRFRKSFGQSSQSVSIPNLIELQKKSYESFLQKDVDPDRRGDLGFNLFLILFFQFQITNKL